MSCHRGRHLNLDAKHSYFPGPHFVSAVMGIALGLEQFQAMVKGWLDAF
jgi:hypothetical protein